MSDKFTKSQTLDFHINSNKPQIPNYFSANSASAKQFLIEYPELFEKLNDRDAFAHLEEQLYKEEDD